MPHFHEQMPQKKGKYYGNGLGGCVLLFLEWVFSALHLFSTSFGFPPPFFRRLPDRSNASTLTANERQGFC